MRQLVTTLALGLAVIAGGCAEFQEMGISTRNKNAAYSAWKRAKWDYFRQGVPHRTREHLGRGFQQGYFDVAAGGNGQVPLFPPNYYWGVTYQNPRGTELIGAWFRGYQDGAIAAERDNLGRYTTLPSSWAPPYAPGTTTPEQNNAAGEQVPPMPGMELMIPNNPDGELQMLVPEVTPPALPPVRPPANPPLIKPKSVDPSAEAPTPEADSPVALTSAEALISAEAPVAKPSNAATTATQATLFVDEQSGALQSSAEPPSTVEPISTTP